MCPAQIFAATDSGKSTPVDFSADQVIYDDVNQIITLRGNVEMEQSGRILKADEISHELKTDTAHAKGKVVLLDEKGNTYFADELTLQKDMKEGFIAGLKTLLNDGSRFTAREGRRTEGRKTEMVEATYTPCLPCKKNPEKFPWMIKADKVTHDQAEKTIEYEDATMELFGLPVAWLPYFSHPDGTERQKSGVLPPSFGYDSEMGLNTTQRYYWAVAPDTDATFGIRAYTKDSPVMQAQYRKKYNHAEMEWDGSFTYSDRTDRTAGNNVNTDKDPRGHLFGEGVWDMNDKWRSGYEIAVTSDNQYLRQYDVTSKRVLENRVYAERFDARDYAVFNLLAYQDTRINRTVDQPNILPEIQAQFLGDPGSFMGGRWEMDMYGLGVQREGSDQDVMRFSTDVGWKGKHVSKMGLVHNLSAFVQTDLYHVTDQDLPLTDPDAGGNNSEYRVIPMAQWQVSYPFAKRNENSQTVIEPIVSFTATPNIDLDADIPNEDSQDVQIDASNLFEANRFPGRDLIEDSSHVTYGMRTGIFGDSGSMGSVFLGQSYRLQDDDNPFPVGSGLSNQRSDIVGQVTGRYEDNLELNYRFQLDSNKLKSERHELDAYGKIGALRMGTTYLYANALAGTGLTDREQINTNLFYKFTDDWQLRTGTVFDLSNGDKELRRADLGLDYLGECLGVSFTTRRSVIDPATGESDLEFFFNIGLKNLGEFKQGQAILPH